jgi:hypothetical protein
MGTKIRRGMVLGSVLIAVSGVVAILLFLPAPYAVWFRIKSPAEHAREANPASFGINLSFARSDARGPRAKS